MCYFLVGKGVGYLDNNMKEKKKFYEKERWCETKDDAGSIHGHGPLKDREQI